jgi:N-acyl-D-amino-acid deacylase
MIDLAIRNGLIVDGTGLPAYRGDLGVVDGKITAIGRVVSPARHELDATGLVVAPGFVDPHTHFDAQLLFDPFATPVMEHGVTTVVTGNCSLSLAPLRVDQRDRFSAMFRLIEEMPAEAFEKGVDWRWGEDFGAMVKALTESAAINVAPLVGHSVLRMFVMGDDAQGRAATDTEIDAMASLLRSCLDQGAVGMSTSFVDIDPAFRPVPSRWATFDELDRLCAVLGERGRMLQIVPEFYDAGLAVSRIEMLADLSLRHGIPTTPSPLFHSDVNPDATRLIMDAVDRAWSAGARVWQQVQTRPVDLSFTLDARSAMFLTIPGWWEVLSLPDHDSRLAAFRDVDVRRRLVDSLNGMESFPGLNLEATSFIVREVADDRNRPLVGRNLGDIAAERHSTPADVLIDVAESEDLGTWFVRKDVGHTDSVVVGDLLTHPHVEIGASDAGAHVGSFATYGDTGLLFSRFVREAGRLTLEAAVKKLTSDQCTIWGLPNRGQLIPGYAADVVVFDAEAIDRGPERLADDFPGGSRWVRDSIGVNAVAVNGEVVWTERDGYAQAARPGQIATP